jgi:D-alanyl-D-alanine carboxypeptidase
MHQHDFAARCARLELAFACAAALCALAGAVQGSASAPQAALASALEAHSAQQHAGQAAADAELSAQLEAIRARADVPGLIAGWVELDGSTSFGACGVRERGRAEALQLADRVHIGSCGKAMTASLCALLAERGTVRWDAPLSDACPELGERLHGGWAGADLLHALGHRAGAPATLDAHGVWLRLLAHEESPRAQRAWLASELLARAPEHAPRETWVYSNAGYALCGAVLERATDRDFETLMERELFEPLGMHSAGFGAPGSAAAVDAPRGHRSDGTPVQPGRFADNPVAISPAGRMHCNVGDWARFLQLHLRRGEKPASTGERAESSAVELEPAKAAATSGAPVRGLNLSPASLERLHAPLAAGEPRYALGWIVLERPWGGTVLTHSGSNTYWHATAWLAPERGFALLAVVNQGGPRAARACDEAVGAALALRAARAPRVNASNPTSDERPPQQR